MTNQNLVLNRLVLFVICCSFFGCTSSQLISNSPDSPSLLSQRTPASASRSWITREAKTSALMYVSSEASGDVYVFTYPREKLIGTLTGFSSPAGLCSDKQGNVFVANSGGGDILEYAHGGTSPIATLSDSGYEPFSCSVDETTGNLAVANEQTTQGGQGNVAIFPQAKEPPTFYSDPQIYNFLACGYDNVGNLFVDGYNGSSNFAELAKGSATFKHLTLTFMTPGGIQWDGQYVAVGSIHGESNGSVIYRLSVTGSTVQIAGSVPLSRGNRKVSLRLFWIGKKHVEATFNNHVGKWPYPLGGSPTAVLSHYVGARGITVSRV